MFETFLQDLKIGFRVLRKEKSFCALAIFVLALGIGGVTTQFAVVNGVLLHAFNFDGADRLVDVQIVDPEEFSPTQFNAQLLSKDYADMRERQQSFEYFCGYLNGSTVNLTYQGQPIRLTGGYVSHDFFSALGVLPVIGRNFTAEDNRPGVTKAVLLSDALWRSNFGADPNVVGRAVRVNGAAGEIVGVMPPRFQFPANEQLWIPLHAEFPVIERGERGANFVAIMGKLRPGVSIDQAQAEITSFARGFAADYPDTNAQFSLGFVRPLISNFTGPFLTGLLWTMFVFCVGVLLIACVNVMNMQFARATLRGKELAIRSSLGASRLRLIRQMLTESLLLSGIGAVIGILFAAWATDFLDQAVHNSTNPIPSWMTFTLDLRVLAIVVVATMVSTVVSGFVPAWMSSRSSAVDMLKEGGRGNTSRSVLLISRGLVVFQITVTCVLLIGSLLQLQAIRKQQQLDFGYDTTSVLAGRMGLMDGDYPTSADRQLFYEKLLRELNNSGQFEAAALTNRFRMVFSGAPTIEIEGQQYLADSDRPRANTEQVSPDYFAALGLRMIDGRNFTENDSDQSEPVAIVNAAFARKFFGNESPLNRRVRTTNANGTNPSPWRRIVGVVPTTRMQGPFNNQVDEAGFYVPFFATPFGPLADAPIAPQFGTVLVRPRAGQTPLGINATLASVVKRVDPNLPMYFVETPAESLRSFLTQSRLIGQMFLIFGLVAVSLAAVGLYGIMSFSVTQRTQEFGVRMALGADQGSILSMVLRQGAIQLAIGLTLGMALTLTIAVLGGEGIENALRFISPYDWRTYTGVAFLLTLVAGISTLVPARRATHVDPMIALRSE